MFGIYHVWDEDGGFGDAVQVDELVALCYDKDTADAFVAKHSNKHVYDNPYCCLECGELVARDLGELPVIEPKHIDERPSLGEWADSALDGYMHWYYKKKVLGKA